MGAVMLSVVLLVAGLLFGLRPISAQLTQISPVVKQLTVPCGVGFLPGAPAASGDMIALDAEPGVVLPKRILAEHCDQAAGWWPYAAWALTGLGIAGLAVLFALGRVSA